MNNKPEKREVVFLLETYPKNRIVNKIIKELNHGDSDFKILDVETCGDSRIFEIRVLSDESDKRITNILKIKLCTIIEKIFPLNYQFDFRERRLGFTYSFNVFINKNSFCFECYTRIKEIRCDGSSVLPEPNNQIKL